MSKRVILHIGLHKTATTWFQRTLWPRWPGIRYLGKPKRHRSSSYAAAIDEQPDPAFLVSSESLSGSLTSAYLHGGGWLDLFRERIDSIRDDYMRSHDVRVVLGLRRHDMWIHSIYKHYLKYGGIATQRAFIGDNGVGPASPFTEADLSFRPRVDAIRDRLGVEPFLFFVEELAESPERLMADLAGFIGSSPPRQHAFSRRRLNEGVGRLEAPCVRWLNSRVTNRGVAPDERRLRAIDVRMFKLVRRLSRVHLVPRGSELALDENTAAGIRERFRDDLDGAVSAVVATRPGYRVPGGVARALGEN